MKSREFYDVYNELPITFINKDDGSEIKIEPTEELFDRIDEVTEIILKIWWINVAYGLDIEPNPNITLKQLEEIEECLKIK